MAKRLPLFFYHHAGHFFCISVSSSVSERGTQYDAGRGIHGVNVICILLLKIGWDKTDLSQID